MKKIKLTKEKFTIVNDRDFEKVCKYKWHTHQALSNRLYAIGSVNGERISMHRFLLSVPEGKEIDHKNGNGLDNRRCNLRICTHLENLRNKKIYKNNKSGFKGIYKTSDNEIKSRNKKWRATVYIKGKKIGLGCYLTPIEAARAYDRGAIKYYGEFAKTNFLRKELPCHIRE